MIVGIGLDVVETARLASALTGDFEARAFTAGERAACADRIDRDQALAARFAAKEACFKALGTGWGGQNALQHVEVVGGANGAPELRLTGGAATRAQELGVRRVHVSLSHQPGIAVATVILED